MGDWFYRFVVRTGRFPFWVSSRPVVLHAKRAPRNGPFILAANHTSPYDVPLLMRHTPRRLDFVSITEVFRNPASLVDENTCKADAELVGNFAFDRISLGNFNGTKIHEVDEIRVGTTFRAVTGRRGRGPDRLVPRVAGREAADPRLEAEDRGA